MEYISLRDYNIKLEQKRCIFSNAQNNRYLCILKFFSKLNSHIYDIMVSENDIIEIVDLMFQVYNGYSYCECYNFIDINCRIILLEIIMYDNEYIRIRVYTDNDICVVDLKLNDEEFITFTEAIDIEFLDKDDIDFIR